MLLHTRDSIRCDLWADSRTTRWAVSSACCARIRRRLSAPVAELAYGNFGRWLVLALIRERRRMEDVRAQW